MGDENRAYNIGAIRDLLVFAFNVNGLRDLFFLAKNQDLRPVVELFASADGIPTMASKAIEYCQAHFLLEELLAAVKEANPRAYERFEKELRLPVSDDGPPGGTPTKTILILAANPKGCIPSRLDDELSQIDNGLQRAKKRDAFSLKQKWATSQRDVHRAMLDYKPNIVHFCGHGRGSEGIVLEDEMGYTKPVPPEWLERLFKLFSNHVECVLLHACYSEAQADAIAQHIDYVVGMEGGIEDKAAIEFAVAFYDALGADEPFEFAFSLACNAIRWAGLPEGVAPILKGR